MADLDDFFAKKDRKKAKGKKFTTTDEVAKKLEETGKRLEKPKPKEKPANPEGEESQQTEVRVRTMKMSSMLSSSTSSFDDASPSASSGTRGRARRCHVCCARMRGTQCSLPGTMHDTCSALPRTSAGRSARVIRVAAAVSAHGFSS